MRRNGRRLDQRDLILLAIEDITARRHSEQRQKVLMGELQHRVKNILMSVRALSQQTRLGSRDLQDYGRVFDGRLDALPRTQDLLLKGSDAIPLDALLRLELTAAGAREVTTTPLDRPAVTRTGQATQDPKGAGKEKRV